MGSADIPPEGPVDSGPGVGLIFVSDASAEAERLTVALRSRGYPTIDVPLGLLQNRVAVQRPDLILCDADASDALETLQALRERAGSDALPVVLLGDANGALERGELTELAQASFTRPVEVYTLLRKVEALIGAPPEDAGPGPLVTTSRAPVLVAAARKPYRYEGARSDDAPPSDAALAPASRPSMPSSLPPDQIEARPASVSASADSAEPRSSEMSPALSNLLAEAEQRMAREKLSDQVTPRLSPEAELDALLPSDVLASLDEPLDDDDDLDLELGHGTRSGSEDEGTSPGSRTGEPTPGSKTGGMNGERRSSAPPPGSDTRGGAPSARPIHMPAEDEEEDDDPQSRVTNPGGPLSSFGRPLAQAMQTLPPGTSTSERTSEPPPTPSVAPRATASSPSAAPVSATPSSSIDGFSVESSGKTSLGTNVQSDLPGPLSATTAGAPASSELEVDADMAPLSALATAVRERATGALVVENSDGIRRVVLRDGDFVTAASGAGDESLVGFLSGRGDLDPEASKELATRLPAFGRHAGAALIAHGHLKQDELWSVLRAHAEWLIGVTLKLEQGHTEWERDIPERLSAEPAVFGGSTGAEVFVETVRRILEPRAAWKRLGGSSARLFGGAHAELLGECALSRQEVELVRRAREAALETLAAEMPSDFPCVLLALVELGVLASGPVLENPSSLPPQPSSDGLDDQALRTRVKNRLALVMEGDYFSLLGVARSATEYQIRRAYEDLKAEFAPSRILTARNADLSTDVTTIHEVLDEAFDILSDAVRRERYRRAIEAVPR